MKTKLAQAVVAGFLATVATFAAASPQTDQTSDQKWFAVEVIVFRPTSSMAGGNEMWPADPRLPDLKKAVVPVEPDESSTNPTQGQSTATSATARQIRSLPSSSYRLTGIWKKLKQSGRYQTLIHTGWIEPGLSGGNAPSVSITPIVPKPSTRPTIPVYSDNSFGSPPPSRATTPVDVKETSDASTELVSPAEAPAFGTVRLAYNSYLRVVLDIAYRPTDPAALRTWRQPNETAEMPSASTTARPQNINFGQYFSPTPPVPRAIVLNTSRRVDASDINYFDNPLFGVILQVTPLDSPPEANQSNRQYQAEQK